MIILFVFLISTSALKVATYLFCFLLLKNIITCPILLKVLIRTTNKFRTNNSKKTIVQSFNCSSSTFSPDQQVLSLVLFGKRERGFLDS